MAVSIKTVDVEKEKEAAREEGYKQGLEDAWEIARKMDISSVQEGGYSLSDIVTIFGKFYSISEVIKKFSIHEVREKIEAYEAEKTKPKLGDVVKCTSKNDDTVRIGILAYENEAAFGILFRGLNGFYTSNNLKNVCTIKKTGKHFDIQSMLDEIG